MSATPPPSVPPVRTPIDVRLVQWFAIELILDSRARLVEGGAGGDTRIDLAQVFVDLPVVAWSGRDPEPDDRPIVRSICQEPEKADDGSAVSAFRMRRNVKSLPRAVIIGGPGSGKSTVTTMVSQLLRLEQVRSRLDDVAAPLRERARDVARGLEELRERLKITACRELLPLRVNLPELSRWMASRNHEHQGKILWRFLASRAAEHAAICGVTLELAAGDLEELVRAHGHVLWIFDGLDEVPRSAGRDRAVAVIRAEASPVAERGVLVTTRPQGYEGEFGDLDALILTEMPSELALDYGKRLLRAWSGTEDPQLNDRLASLQEEFAKPRCKRWCEALCTRRWPRCWSRRMARCRTRATCCSSITSIPFDTIFKRELGKKGDHGVRREDKQLLRTLHARAGLVLHTRSQERAGARPTLSPRELSTILEAIFGEEGRSVEDAQALAERLLRFSADRLVLLLRVTDGGYAFGIRSLQEFFAGIALVDGEPTEVTGRLEAIALNPHWSNVLGLIVSGLAVSGAGPRAKASALIYTRGLCRSLNDGMLGGRAAAACVAGSRLAIAMLRETERYGGPWLHDPLWEIALEVASSSVQARSAEMSSLGPQAVSAQWGDDLEVHTRLGALALGWKGTTPDKWLHRLLESAKAQLAVSKEHPSAGWRLLLPALQSEDPRAVRIADENAPETPQAARRVLENALDWRGHIAARWITTFVNEHVAWFPPGWILSKCSPGFTRLPDSGAFSPRRLSWTANSKTYLNIYLGEHVDGALFTLDAVTAIWSKVALPIVAESVEWRAWHKLAAFHAEPSKDRLADVLEVVAEPLAWIDMQNHLPLMAWPARDCLNFVSDPVELRLLAASVRAGRLGDVEDWKAAEAR